MLEILVVVTILAILAVFLIAGVNRMLERSRAVACATQLANLGRITMAYANDHKMHFPILWFYTGRTYNFPHPPGGPGRGGPQGSYNLSYYRALGEGGYSGDENDYSWAYSPSDRLSPNERRGWTEGNEPYGMNVDYEYTPFRVLGHEGPAVPYYANASRRNTDRSGYWFQYNRKRGASENKLWARHGGICNVWFTDGRVEAIPEDQLFERLPGATFYRSSSGENVAR